MKARFKRLKNNIVIFDCTFARNTPRNEQETQALQTIFKRFDMIYNPKTDTCSHVPIDSINLYERDGSICGGQFNIEG